jgi:hypothetical protein
MAILQISEVSDSVVELYANASAAEQRQLARVVEEILVLLKNPSLPTNPVKVAKRSELDNPFSTSFQPLKMKGNGPTGAEMVIQGRR